MREGFINRTQLLGLQRDASDYVAQRRQNTVANWRWHGERVGELEARMAQARNQYQQQAADELKEASAKVRELAERLRPSQDQVERQMVRSPVDGEVMSMRVSAVGEVIGPREPILDVVPEHEKLVVEARIHPQDIDHVHKDAPAEVRLSAFDARSVPLLPGEGHVHLRRPRHAARHRRVVVRRDRRGGRREPEELSADSPARGHAGGAVRHHAGTHPVPVPHQAAEPVLPAARCASHERAMPDGSTGLASIPLVLTQSTLRGAEQMSIFIGSNAGETITPGSGVAERHRDWSAEDAVGGGRSDLRRRRRRHRGRRRRR